MTKDRGLYQRSGGIWWMNVRGNRESTNTTNIKLARDIIAKKRAEFAENKHLDIKRISPITLKQYIPEFITNHSKAEMNRTWKEDERILYNFFKIGTKEKGIVFEENIKLADIHIDLIKQYQTARLSKHFIIDNKSRKHLFRNPVTNDTINRDLNVLSSLLSYAEENRLIDRNILYKRKKLPKNPNRERFLSDTELDWVAKNAPRVSMDLYDVIVAYVNTGFRKQEVTSLKWPRIDFDHNSILLTATNTKSKRSRYQPMNQMLKEVLLRRKLGRDKRTNNDFVFPATKISQKGFDFRKQFEKLRELAKEPGGIADFTTHDFRRTYATIALKLTNGNLSAVQKLLGHDSPETTKKYAHTAATDLVNIVDQIGFHNVTKMTQISKQSEKEQFDSIISGVDMDS